MNSPEAVLIVKAPVTDSYFLKELRKQWPGLLVIHHLSSEEEPNFKFFGLEGEINPISGRYEVAQHLVNKLTEEEQQKLYEELHTEGHRIY